MQCTDLHCLFRDPYMRKQPQVSTEVELISQNIYVGTAKAVPNCHCKLSKLKMKYQLSIASFPGPTQVSVACSMEKQERAWYLFSRE